MPATLLSSAVVWRPVASTIVNTSGSTHEPLVIALKKPPLVFTIELTSVTLFGNVDDDPIGRRAAVDVVVDGEAVRALALERARDRHVSGTTVRIVEPSVFCTIVKLPTSCCPDVTSVTLICANCVGALALAWMNDASPCPWSR